jgi:hypothetical protein
MELEQSPGGTTEEGLKTIGPHAVMIVARRPVNSEKSLE